MNLLKFLNTVDSITSEMSSDQLISFIHEIARVLPESKRESFLNELKSNLSDLEKEEKHLEKYLHEYNDLKEKFGQIERNEVSLFASYNEMYEHWNDNYDEFFFGDPEGIGDIVDKAYDFVNESIDKQQYDYGNEIASLLLGIDVDINSDGYCDYCSFDIYELTYHDIVYFKYDKFILKCLYLAYQVNKLEDRANIIYKIIKDKGSSNISLEMIMQCGEELRDLDDFLPRWIQFLGKEESDIANKLLNEAINLKNNSSNLLEGARLYYEKHPELYEKYIIENTDKVDFDTLISVGNEALEKINPKYLIRSKIALHHAELMLRKHNQVIDDVENYWYEAFCSDSSITNFLRIMMECRDFSKWKERLQVINHSNLNKIDASYRQSYGYSNDLDENIPNQYSIYLIAFLNGEYEYVKNHALNFKDELGWSHSFMKEGLSAFLLLLYDGEFIENGIMEMIYRLSFFLSFDVDDYNAGLIDEVVDDNEIFFWKCFKKSKSQNYLSENDQQKYLLWTKQLVEKRVAAIMEGMHRNSYHECAGFVAALGEVLESRGIIDNAQSFMLEYKNLYPRRTLFHKRLRNFGMMDKLLNNKK